jgi:hypothetical protein
VATNDSTRYQQLRARVAALSFELIIGDDGAQFVLGGKHGTEVVFIHRNESDDDLSTWIQNREREADATGQTRDAAQCLKDFEAESLTLPFNEILKYLDDCNIVVSLDLVEELGDVKSTVRGIGHEDAEYSVGHRRWSEQGVRHAWAEQRLLWKLRGVTENDPSLGS